MKLLTSLILHYIEHGEEAVCHQHPTKTDVVNRCIKELEQALNEIDWPEVGSDQLLALVVKNLTNTDGSVSIDVTVLENPVTLGSLQLRDNTGALEVSDDDGATWSPVPFGLPAEVENPVTLGALLLHEAGGLLQISRDAGATWITILEESEVVPPGEIASPVVLGSLQLRDNSGVFELSDDNGNTWDPVAQAQELPDISPKIPGILHAGFDLWADNPSGDIMDWSFNQHAITNHNTVVLSDEQKVLGAKSLKFAGTNYLSMAAHATLEIDIDDFTFFARIFQPSLPSAIRREIISCGDLSTDDGAWAIAVSNESLGFCYRRASIDIPDYWTTGGLSSGAWERIAVIRSAGNIYFYLNESLIGQFVLTDTHDLGQYPVYIGHSEPFSYSPNNFVGYLDDVVLIKGQALVPTAYPTIIANQRFQDALAKRGQIFYFPGATPTMYFQDDAGVLFSIEITEVSS